MAQASRFTAAGSVVLNGSGYGYVRLAPAGLKWEIDRVTVLVSTKVSEARCLVYLNNIATQNIIGGTYSGSSGDSNPDSIYLEDGSAIFIEWTGGDAGATATVTIAGWRSVNEGGFRAVH